MLHYTHGSLNVPSLQNSGNLFVHRLANDSPERNRDMILTSYTSANNSSNTYWKSPNTVETTGLPSNGICLPPEMTVTSKFTHRPKSGFKTTVVKGILKNKDTSERDITVDMNMTPRSSYQSFNDDAAGDKAKLPGSGVKRVQFDGIPKQQEATKKHETMSEKFLAEGKASERKVKSEAGKQISPNTYDVRRVPFGGMYMFRKGNSANSSTRRPLQTNNDTASRSQISAFIKKLRLVESAKLKRAEESLKHMEKLDREIAHANDKLRRAKIKSAMWPNSGNGNSNVEQNTPKTDSERAKTATTAGRANNKPKRDETFVIVANNRLKPRFDSNHDESGISKELLPTNSFLLSETEGGRFDKLKRQRAVSAYTRYNTIKPSYLKLWKPDESNCYKDDRERLSNLSSSKQSQVTNYCDSGKTSQILGWLSDLTAAKPDKPILPPVTQNLVNEEVNEVENVVDSPD